MQDNGRIHPKTRTWLVYLCLFQPIMSSKVHCLIEVPASIDIRMIYTWPGDNHIPLLLGILEALIPFLLLLVLLKWQALLQIDAELMAQKLMA
jgi:hypothetical protein